MADTSIHMALAAWRAAERELESSAGDDPARAARADAVSHSQAAYQRAVLASRGRVDQLEAVAEGTWDRVAASGELRTVTREALRRP